MAEQDGESGESARDPSEGGGAGAAGAPAGQVSPPDEGVWTAMWVSYRDGVRRKDRLKRMHRVGWRTVDQAIEHGWPAKGWPSFKERLELWERQKGRSAELVLAEADRVAAEAAAQQQVVTWLQFQPKAAKLCTESLGALTVLGGKLKEAVKVASFIRYRKVRQRQVDPKTKKVKVITVEQPYVDGVAVAHAMRVFAQAFKETGTLMSFLMGGPTGRTEINLPELTQEQMQQLRAGQIPEGVTLEQVASAFLAGAGYAQGES